MKHIETISRTPCKAIDSDDIFTFVNNTIATITGFLTVAITVMRLTDEKAD